MVRPDVPQPIPELAPSDIATIIERHVNERLETDFGTTPALLVVYDRTTSRFVAGGHNRALADLIGVRQIEERASQGMTPEEGGLLEYAYRRLVAGELWAYAVVPGNVQMFETPIGTGDSPATWEAIDPDICKPGPQLKDFAQLVCHGNRRSVMTIVPYTMTQSLVGLVILIWIEDGRPEGRLSTAATLLRGEGVLLSAYQVVIAGVQEKSRRFGYSRLAHYVQHETKGFRDSFQGLWVQACKASILTQEDEEFYWRRLMVMGDLQIEMSGEDPLHFVDPDHIHDGYVDLPNALEQTLHRIRTQFSDISNLSLDGKVALGSGGRCQIRPTVFHRIIKNCISNSVRVALERQIDPIKVRVTLEKQEANQGTPGSGSYMDIVVEDNAGGILDPTFPSPIEPRTWLAFCEDHQGLSRKSHGTGFWLLSRFAVSTGGTVTWANVPDRTSSPVGLRVTVRLGVPTVASSPPDAIAGTPDGSPSAATVGR